MKKLLLAITLCLSFICPSLAMSAGYGAETYGDALYGYGGTTYKVAITGNNGTYSYILVDATGAYDYAVRVTGTGNTFENCTFYAPNGIALKAEESCTITNNILEGNTQDITITAAKTVTAKNNLLHHHADATDNIGDGTYTDTDSVYALDPLFWDLAGQNFRLTAPSPARDAGFNTGADTDVAGIVTPQFGVHDIGAYEYSRRSSGPTTMGLGLSGYAPHRIDD